VLIDIGLSYNHLLDVTGGLGEVDTESDDLLVFEGEGQDIILGGDLRKGQNHGVPVIFLKGQYSGKSPSPWAGRKSQRPQSLL